jgi:hypothetical protein
VKRVNTYKGLNETHSSFSKWNVYETKNNFVMRRFIVYGLHQILLRSSDKTDVVEGGIKTLAGRKNCIATFGCNIYGKDSAWK